MQSEAEHMRVVETLGLAVFEDLNRPTDDEIGALKVRLGFTDDEFYRTSEDPATRALKYMLRAATTARSAKRGENA